MLAMKNIRSLSWLCALLASAVCLLCVLISRPYVEIGVNDDWCYIRGAQTLATTGHVVYHAYESATLGWQLFLGAAFIKLFGFSFTTTRASLLPISMLTVLLLHRVLVRSGVRLGFATVGALALSTSPLFLPLAFSFMSDVPGLFTLLLCAYLCMRAMQANTDRAALIWLVTASFSNVALGTVRQIAWLGAIAIVPSAIYLMRKRRHAIVVGVSALAVSLVLIRAAIHWFDRQPYALPEKLIPGAFPANTAHLLAENGFDALATLALLLLPVLIGFLVPMKWLRLRQYMWPAASTALFALFLLREYGKGRLTAYLLPMMQNYVTDQGTMLFVPGALGLRGVVLSHAVRIALTLGVAAVVSIAITVCAVKPWQAVSGATDKLVSLRFLGYFWAPFIGLYIVLLVPRTLFFALFDRYLLPLFVVALVFALRALQVHVTSRSQYRLALTVQGVVLFLFGCYSTAVTHDAFAADRARLNAVKVLTDRGVPRQAITAGFEYDGTTQLDAWGYVNYPGIKNPTNAFKAPIPLPKDDDPRSIEEMLFPVVVPDYLVSYQPKTIGEPADIAPLQYSTWLSRKPQYIYFQKLRSSQ